MSKYIDPTCSFMQNNEIFRRLEKVTSMASLTPEERRSYEADVKNTRDTLNQIRGAFQDGEKKGRAEGHAEGLAEGHAEGFAEGRKEEKVEMARRMLAIPLPYETIMHLTGLSYEELVSL